MPGAGMYGLKSPPPRGRFRAPSYPYPTLCYEPVNLQKHKLQYIWVQMVPPPQKNQKVIYNIYINTFQGD